jgi:HlyD family secretion protein
MTPKMKRILIVVLLIAGGGGTWWYTRDHAANGRLMLQGNVEVRQVNLGFKAAGRIEHLNVDEGDAVKAGQPLASLEKVYFEDTLAQMRAQRGQMAANYAKLKAGSRPEEIAQARAAVAEREAAVTNAKITRERAEQLLHSAVGSQKTFDDAAAAERQIDAQLNSARQALRLAETGFRKEDIDLARDQLAERDTTVKIAGRQLADAELIAPSDGMVLSRVREVGAIVNAGDTVYVLSLTSPVWVRTYVAEPDLTRIQPGMEVIVRTDAKDGVTYKGRIGFISTTAEFTPKSVETTELRTALVYRVRVVIDGAAGALRQGMPVTVVVPAVSYLVPVSANIGDGARRQGTQAAAGAPAEHETPGAGKR